MKKMLIACAIGVSLIAVRAEGQISTTNAALRYWMAFAEMKDPPAVTNGVTLELLDRMTAGTAPLDDRITKILDDNAEALAILQRASKLRNCDWGLEYELGPETPIAHLAKGRVLGRLNNLAAQRFAAAKQWQQAVDVWLASVRFSQHLAQGGSLIALLSARSILKPALNGLVTAAAQPSINRTEMLSVVRALPEAEFDWDAAMKREEEALAFHRRQNPGKGEMPDAARIAQEREASRADRSRALAALSR